MPNAISMLSTTAGWFWPSGDELAPIAYMRKKNAA